MTMSPPVLLLDDGELEDVQEILTGLDVPYGRIRGGAIAPRTPAPSDLLIATPRRIGAVSEISGADSPKKPVRIVVVSEDSVTLRESLRRTGFDYLVRRPVHPEALRLLLVHCLYKGEERRGEPRVPVGFEISFRTGLLQRRATLADLSRSGCRLLTRTPLEAGKRIRIQIPEALEAGDPFTVSGRVVRVNEVEGGGRDFRFRAAVAFDRVTEEAAQALELLIEDRAQGPATLRRAVERRPDPTGAAIPASDSKRLGRLMEPSNAPPEATPPEAAVGPQPTREAAEGDVAEPVDQDDHDIEVGVQLETTPDAEESEKAEANEERRRFDRHSYAQKVPAFSTRALRVLVGRDLSMGGMRIERLPDLEIGDRLHFALYGEPGDPPFLVWGTVTRDDEERGMGVVFDEVESEVGAKLERLVGGLPAVESLHDDEAEALGTVLSEVLER